MYEGGGMHKDRDSLEGNYRDNRSCSLASVTLCASLVR